MDMENTQLTGYVPNCLPKGRGSIVYQIPDNVSLAPLILLMEELPLFLEDVRIARQAYESRVALFRNQ